MAGVNVCEAASHEHAEGQRWWNRRCEPVRARDEAALLAWWPTLPVSGMPRVDIEGLLALSDGSSQRKVGLHHPLLVVAIDNGLRGHGQRVTLGHVLGQGGQ